MHLSSVGEIFPNTCAQSEEHQVRAETAPVLKKAPGLHNERLRLLEHMVSFK